jgi:hypothetical protein
MPIHHPLFSHFRISSEDFGMTGRELEKEKKK